MFVDKLVRNILDVLLDGNLTYNHEEMIEYLSGSTVNEFIHIQASNNYITVETPKYQDGEYFKLNYQLNDVEDSLVLKCSKNRMVDREKCISIILHKLI